MSALRELNETISRGSVSLLAPGTNFARAALALARTHNRSEAIAYAEQQWGAQARRRRSSRPPSRPLRRPIRPGSVRLSEHRTAAAEFVPALRPSQFWAA